MSVNIQKYNLRLVKESGARYELEDRIISHPQDAFKVFIEVADLHLRTEEVMMMLALDSQNKLIGVFEVAVGSLTKNIASPREILKRAILCNAASIILGHNHPSESLKPSSEDIEFTETMMESCQLMNISFFDHLIVAGKDKYLSLKFEDYI